MSEAIVILVNGEVLSGSHESTILDQKNSAKKLARGLLPIFDSDLNVALMHGNKPQVGYVLFRSEIASHVLHQVPLDVCGADTQGATGYMISQSITNVLWQNSIGRKVMPITTQTIIDADSSGFHERNRQIGPWLDRERADQRRQVYGWHISEEPGYGYRRVVASPPPVEIVEIEGIKQLVQSGMIVIAAGGGGVPVMVNKDGMLEGVEAVVDTDQVACMLASQINAKILLMVVEDEAKFITSGIKIDEYSSISDQDLKKILHDNMISSDMVKRKLSSAHQHIQQGGGQVIITTLEKLSQTLKKESGLWISGKTPLKDLAELI